VDRYGEEWSLRSINRSLILLLINYFEMIMSGKDVINDAGTALYFSIVTITTLGYGDYTPIGGLGRFLVSAETIMGIVFIVLVLSTFIGGIHGLWNREKE
jgi:voltage-gated potassium channel